MPRYSRSCPAGSQVRGEASPDASDPDYAWIVNFNNGNVNLNHRDNNAWVRAVRVSRASEYPWINAAAEARRRFPVGSEAKVRNIRFWKRA